MEGAHIFKVVFTLLSLIAAAIWATKTTTHVVDGTSMSPNFKNGESYTTYTLRWEKPEVNRGDVVSAFLDPNNPQNTYMKRVVGVEGDILRLTIDGLILSINGEYINYSNVRDDMSYTHQFTGAAQQTSIENSAYSLVINEAHSGIDYDIMFLCSPPSAAGTYAYLERKRKSGYYDTFTYNQNGIAEIIVPKEHYFLLSDNRPSGLDSRVLGFLHKSKIYRVVKQYDYD